MTAPLDESRRGLFRFALAAGSAAVVLQPTPAGAAEPDEDYFQFFVGKNAKQLVSGEPVVHWTIEPKAAEEGRARFALVSSNVETGGQQNPFMFLGYNAEAFLPRERDNFESFQGLDGEPALVLAFEGFYRAENWAGSGIQQDTTEAYFEYRSADRSIRHFRPFATTVGRDDNEARWATTHIDLGADPSNAKSQFTILGAGPIFQATNNFTAVHRHFLVEGASTYMNSVEGGRNAHVMFSQDSRARWSLSNFHGDPNHYLWDHRNGRRHAEYVAGEDASSATTRFYSQLEALGRSSFEDRVAFQGPAQFKAEVGFNGAAPIAQRAGSAEANDLQTVIRLANELLTDLVAYGFKAQSALPEPEPTPEPTPTPTEEPSPTDEPTSEPTESPSSEPTPSPTSTPGEEPSSASPTSSPS